VVNTFKNTEEIKALVNKMGELGFRTEFGEKNANGIKYDTLIIGEGSLRPSLTIDADLINEIVNDGAAAVAKRLAKALENDSDIPVINPDEIASADYIRKHSFLAVGNKAMAEDEDIVGYLKNDVFQYVRVNVGDGTFVVKKKMLEALGLNRDDLFKMAKANQIARVNDLEDVGAYLNSMGVPVPGTPEMLIVTTRDKVLGASLAFIPEYMDKLLSSMNLKRVFVLPSSIHECLVVPLVPENDEEVAPALAQFTEMVREVNSSAVKDCEVLADHAYLYTVGKGLTA